MTTLRDIVSAGFRESGISAVGAVPSAEEHTEGLRLLNVIITSLTGNQLGDKLLDLSFGEEGVTNTYGKAEDWSDKVNSTFVPSNTRLIFNNESSVTLYLDPRPNDGARLAVVDNAGNFLTKTVTLNGNGRSIETLSSVLLNVNDTAREWFYRADLGNWQRVTDLTASSDVPFPKEFDDYLSILLAMRLNPRFGAETRPELSMMLQKYQGQFRSRYRQTTEEDSEYFLQNLNSRYRTYRGGSTDYFNRGR